jgi:hypothetical protein
MITKVADTVEQKADKKAHDEADDKTNDNKVSVTSHEDEIPCNQQI